MSGLYTRCVWANKFTLASFCGIALSVGAIFALFWYQSDLSESTFRFWYRVLFLILCLFLVIGAFTRMGYASVHVYQKTFRHMLRTGHTNCACLAPYQKKYCWRVGLSLARDDYQFTTTES